MTKLWCYCEKCEKDASAPLWMSAIEVSFAVLFAVGFILFAMKIIGMI